MVGVFTGVGLWTAASYMYPRSSEGGEQDVFAAVIPVLQS